MPIVGENVKEVIFPKAYNAVPRAVMLQIRIQGWCVQSYQAYNITSTGFMMQVYANAVPSISIYFKYIVIR